MKKIIVTLGCLVIAPLAFAQPNSTDKKQGATTTEPICQLSASQYPRCSGGQLE
jgi:hypothetical protein